MRKTEELLQTAIKMGFSYEEAMSIIDDTLNPVLIFRHPLYAETIPEALYKVMITKFSYILLERQDE